MNYSDNKQYVEYMENKASGNIDQALVALEHCLIDFPVETAAVHHAGLLQQIGRLYFEKGRKDEALRYFERSEAVDPNSLLMPYYYAKFLAEQMHLQHEAITKCMQIIERATSHPFVETEEDFGSDDYVRMAEELICICESERK